MVVLVGMMGSGKTSVGRLLARALGRPWMDLDAELVRRWGPIDRQFKVVGEAAFRARESALLKGCLRRPPAVLSTGGGVVLSGANRRLLGRQATVYLQASPAVLARRLDGPQRRKRPLLRGRPLLPLLRSLSVKRAPLYGECALLRVRAGQGSPRQVAERVLRRLRKFGVS